MSRMLLDPKNDQLAKKALDTFKEVRKARPKSAAQPFGSSKTVWLTASLKLVEVAWSSREGAASWWA